MNNIKTALWQNYNDINGRMESMELVSDEYKVASKVRDDLLNELLKLEQLENEKNTKISQIKAENKREWIRTGVTLFTFGVSIGYSIWGVNKTFRFDEVSTVTSTLGRGILQGVVPKITKR